MSIRIDGTNTTANPGITGSDTDTGLQFGTNEIKVVTGGTERATVTSDGDVGVGIASPTTQSGRTLHLHNSGGQQRLHLTTNNSGSAAGDGLDIILEHNTDGDAHILNHEANGDLKLGAGDAERVRLLSTGGMTFNGDTAQVNAIDDYEEGTFTPVWQTTGDAFSSVTYSHQVGYYTKIGNLVHVSLRLRSTASSGGSGNLLIGGLPYPIDDDTGAGGGSPSTFFIDYHNSTINVATETRNDTSQFYLLSSLDNASWSNVGAGGIQGSGTSEIRVSFAYQTDS